MFQVISNLGDTMTQTTYRLLVLVLGLIVVPSVAATTLTGVSIVLDGGGTTINVTGCTWSFTDLKWDSGGGWLSVTDLTVSGSPTLAYAFSKNYTDLSGYYTCQTFPYGEMSNAAVTPARYTILAYTVILPLFGGLFLLAILVPLVVGLGQVLGWVGEVDWSIILQGMAFLAVGAIIAAALTIGLTKLAGG